MSPVMVKILEDLDRRIRSCCEAGGYLHDGTAEDGWHDLASLSNVVMVMRDKLRELELLAQEAEHRRQVRPDDPILQDALFLECLEEHDALKGRLDGAESVLQARGVIS